MSAAELLREHAIAYPPFAASVAAQGCGRVVGGKPTPAQRLYIAELDTHLRERLAPWVARKAELEALVRAEREPALFEIEEVAPA